MMIWIIAALLAAIFNALKNVMTRKVGDAVDVYTVALASNALSLPVLWLNVILLGGIASIEPTFWWLMLLMLPFELLVMFLFFRALTSSNLAHSFPFVSFMPVFVAIGSWFILGEVVNLFVYIGLAVIVAGAFMMNLSRQSDVTDIRGALYILLVAALWGYLIPMGSLAVTYSSAQLYPAIYFSLATALFLPLFFVKRTTPITVVMHNLSKFVGIGLLFGLFTATNWFAYANGPATAIAALAMLSIPLTSVASFAFYGEAFEGRKIVAACVMTVGAVMITVLG